MTRRREIEKCLLQNLNGRGWKLQRIEDLPKAFVKEGILTPYFWPSVRGRSPGWYSIGGNIGILDREFEKLWKVSHPTARNHFPLLMFTTNFAEIGLRCSAVEPQHVEESVARYVDAFDSFMMKWPHSRKELREAFEKGQLMGKEIEAYGWVYDVPEGLALSEKLIEFGAFLRLPH
jgi:hypothetical protein